MKKALWALVAASLLAAVPGQAQDRQVLGYGRLFSNDFFGDGRDRWRTGSYVISQVRGPEWTGALPSAMGEVLEYRLRSEIIAPADIVAPAAGDRRYVGALSLGVHTHFDMAGAEASLGADLVVIGPQTGVGSFQRSAHEALGLPRPFAMDSQIANAVHPTVLAEFGRSYSFGDRLTVRPFVEAQAGVETFVRVGGDLTLGEFGQGGLMLRDVTTGQRYRGVRGGAQGFSLVMGGDVARVFDSAYLPASDPAQLSDTRSRLRAGVHWQGEKAEFFYGVTWLGKEYDSQPDDQLTGSLRLRLRF